jgi:replicative DNA helicase
LQSVSESLDHADGLLRSGERATAWAWPTGFGLLDTYLGGGLRAGELCLLGGPQGLGKTTFAMQIARHVAHVGGSAVVFSYEHDHQQLLERLLAAEVAEAADRLGGDGGGSVRRIREALQGDPQGPTTLAARLAPVRGGAEGLAALQGLGDRLLLHRSLGTSTGLVELREAIESSAEATGILPLVVVDYLQKVHVPGGAAEIDRVTTAVEGLKDLALELELPVVAVVAADKEGLGSGKRLRAHHLRGSSALAYEPDVVLLLNDKYDILARHHLVFDSGNAGRHRGWAVLTIEKNRSGMDHVDLQLRKRFEQARYDTDLQPVEETLLDERVFVE